MKEDMRVCAKIDLDAIKFNLDSMRILLPEETKMMAVIKTDAYGHGAEVIARELESLDYIYGFATATIEEAVSLRKTGIIKPILILGYVFTADHDDLIRYKISATVFSLESAKRLSAAAVESGSSVTVHIKLDTGMSRIGFQINEQSADEICEICNMPGLQAEGLFTHFASADEAEKEESLLQLSRFCTMEQWLNDRHAQIPFLHCCNSAGILELPEAHFDIVRSGITMYGLWPSEEVDHERIPLKPAMSIKSHIVHIKELESGRKISYGGTYTLSEKELIATIPVGYGDGYPRGLSNQGYVLIRGKKAPIRGRICMDQFMVDVTGILDAAIGDEVTLMGCDGEEQITAEMIAAISGRFNYELVCDINKRVPRIFLKNNIPCCRTSYYGEL